MLIETKKIEDLIPADYNPRKITKRQLEELKQSISKFGYIEPIVWNKTTGHVVSGHQRLKVLSELGYKEIECVIIECSEDEEKLLNVTFNKVGGMFEKDKLFSLLNEAEDEDLAITGFRTIDVIDYNLDKQEREAKKYYGDMRERTYNLYRLHEYDANNVMGNYQIPTLKACHYIPERLIPFEYVRRQTIAVPPNCGVHFFVDDYKLEAIWRVPYKVIPRLKNFACTCTPDFSLYLDMPLAMKIWNFYRSMLIGQMMQKEGMNVIPTLTWAGEDTFDFCFDGIEPGGVYAVSTVCVMRKKETQEAWKIGMQEAIKRLKPECILLYGFNTNIDFDFGNVKVKKFRTQIYERAEVSAQED
ncbi:MAG: DUF4417 domain-containing protein [Synergistaceae bacterium]|nr:DUF4417 domain-containing protein [Synergistaceae bacterium]